VESEEHFSLFLCKMGNLIILEAWNWFRCLKHFIAIYTQCTLADSGHLSHPVYLPVLYYVESNLIDCIFTSSFKYTIKGS
jgi:hypothetical protein